MASPTREKLERWSLLLSLPVAVLSIASVVIPPAWNWLKGDYSKLDITLAYTDFERMELLVTNVGNRAAVLTGIQLAVSAKSGTDRRLFSIPKKQKVIKAGEQFLLGASDGMLIPASVAQFSGSTDLPKKTCSAVVKYRQYNSKVESSRFTFSCYAVDHHAAMRIANLSKAGVSIPWSTRTITPEGTINVPDAALFKWASDQPLTASEEKM